ncbi:MAG: hypothetical protein WCH59_08290 [Chitinophagia bacterium]|jgi:hypothetical protein|nr:hypothetical protein [Chitinophagia bacterium]
MLSKTEEDFIAYWSKNGESEKNSLRPLLIGFSFGLVFGVATVISIFSGWAIRATMVANSRLSAGLLLIIILIVSVFMGYFYRSFRWDKNDQYYRELLAKKKRKMQIPMQPNDLDNSLTP